MTINGDATEVLSVRSRPVRNPIFLGLGTAAILAAGGGTAALAAPTPSPSGSEGSTPSASATPTSESTPTPTPTNTQSPETQAPVLGVTATATSATKVTAGKSVRARVHVYSAPNATNTVLKLATKNKKTTISPTCNRSSVGCDLQTVDFGGIDIPVTITIPKGTGTGVITFIATATATGATQAEDTFDITVAKAPAGNSGNKAANSGNSGGGSSNNSTGANNGSTTSTTTIPGSGAAYVPPNAGALAPSTNGVPSAQFPQIAPQTGGANQPVVAGGAAQTQNMGALRAASPEPQELTFQRLASTQAAWLAALLVAFSLLLTHIRLNKPADARRRRGVHRRQRAGVFQA